MSLLSVNTSVFPNNAQALIKARFDDLYGDSVLVVGRRLKVTDDTMSIGVAPDMWIPDESSFEFRSLEPTVSTYTIWIQSFVKNSDEEEGVQLGSVLAKVVRTTLYRDMPLQVGLNSLSVTMMGATETIQRRGIRRSQYLSTEIQGNFLYLNTLEYYIETETK